MRIRVIVAASILLASISGALAQTGTTKPKSTLQSEVGQQLPDNTSGLIAPFNARQVFADVVASSQQAPQVNAQVGTSYTFLASDYGNLVTFNNSGSIAVTLPQAIGSFSPWNVFVANRGAGAVTITPGGGSTINGASTFVVGQNGFIFVVSDGTNYQVWQGLPGSGGSGLITGAMIASATITTTNIASATILGSNIASATITGSNIASATITGSNIAANTVANSNLVQMAADTVQANNTNATANAAAVAISALGLPNQNLAARFGSMDVWQRGAGGSASIAVAASTTLYTVDGCYLATGATEASTVANVAGIAVGSFKAAAITRNSGQTGTTSIVFGCPFDTDEIAQFAGNFVTLSFTASTGANWSPTSGNLTYELFCGTGSVKKQTTGYTGQTTPINTTVAIAAGTAAARYGTTSAAIVPANCTQAEIQFNWTPVGTAGAADTVTIDDVQLEIAPNAAWTAANYFHLDFDAQLSKAQRHFAKTFVYGTAPAQNAGVSGAAYIVAQAAGNIGIWWRYPRQMRTTPTVTSFNPSAANANCHQFQSAADLAYTTSASITTSAEATGGICSGSSTPPEEIGIHFTADAGI